MVSQVERRLRPTYFALLAVSVLSGVWARYLLGPSPLDIRNTHWIYGDLAQVYMAWAQYLNDPHASWLRSDWLSYPLPMSISLFDPMPLFLLLAKSLAWILPDGLQFIGWYFVLCLVMQGMFGYLATVQTLRLLGEQHPKLHAYIGALGGLLIATVPFTFFRFQFNPALSSQWLLVLSIWMVLRTLHAERKPWIAMNGATLLLATGINPYLTLLVAVNCAIAAVVQARRIGWWEVIIRCLALACIATIGLYAFGFLVAAGIEVRGYGMLSMNALGPLASHGLGRLNKLAIGDATGGQSVDGFNYLGLGVLMLCVFPLALCFAPRPKKNDFPFMAALLAIVVCYCLALSTTPTFASYRFHIHLPGGIEYVLRRFRGSGHLFWMAGFWLILLGIAACILRLGIVRAAPMLTLLLLVQLIDIQPVALHTKMMIAKGATQELVGVPAGNYASISVYPAWQCDHRDTPLGTRNYEAVGFFALRHKIPTNNFYAARSLPEQLAYHCDLGSLEERIKPTGIYLLSNEIYQRVQARMALDFDCSDATNGDGSWLCVPRRERSSALSGS
jgi:hypothetical protein